jgi:hypothetical protein
LRSALAVPPWDDAARLAGSGPHGEEPDASRRGATRSGRHLGLDDRHAALDEARAERSHWLALSNVEPTLDALRDDDRFNALVAELRFPSAELLGVDPRIGAVRLGLRPDLIQRLVAVEPAAFHHVLDVDGVPDVLERVRVQHDQIGQLAWFDRAEVVFDTEEVVGNRLHLSLPTLEHDRLDRGLQRAPEAVDPAPKVGTEPQLYRPVRIEGVGKKLEHVIVEVLQRRRHDPVGYGEAAVPSAISALCVSKATMLETIATIQKAMIIHEEGRTARRPRVLTDERG